MITYAVNKSNYAELWGLSTDTKPTGYGAVPNGSLFTEIDTGDTFRFNGEAGDWYDGVSKVPTKLEISSHKYLVTYSDTTTANVTIRLEGDKAVYVENGMKVSCTAMVANVELTLAYDEIEYDGDPHTITAYDDDYGYTVTNDNTDEFDEDTEIGFKKPDASITATEIGEYVFGLTADDFYSLNDQVVVNFSVIEGGLDIIEEQENPGDGGDDPIVY